MNKMIRLGDLSSEARGILAKAIPYQKLEAPLSNQEYIRLFHDFQKATNFSYLKNPEDGELDGFNRFQCAVVDMSRSMKTLDYDKTERDQLTFKDERDWVSNSRSKQIISTLLKVRRDYMKEAMNV